MSWPDGPDALVADVVALGVATTVSRRKTMIAATTIATASTRVMAVVRTTRPDEVCRRRDAATSGMGSGLTPPSWAGTAPLVHGGASTRDCTIF